MNHQAAPPTVAAPTYPIRSKINVSMQMALVTEHVILSRSMSTVLLTTNGHVSEEQPARDQWLLGRTWGLSHDVKIRRIEAQSSGGQTVSHQVDPQQLDGDKSLGQTQGSGQEDTEEKRNQKNQSYSDILG